MRMYTVSKDSKTGLWYAHMVGYSYIPVFSERGTFGTKRNALQIAADSMGLIYREYMDFRKRYRNMFK